MGRRSASEMKGPIPMYVPHETRAEADARMRQERGDFSRVPTPTPTPTPESRADATLGPPLPAPTGCKCKPAPWPLVSFRKGCPASPVELHHRDKCRMPTGTFTLSQWLHGR